MQAVPTIHIPEYTTNRFTLDTPEDIARLSRRAAEFALFAEETGLRPVRTREQEANFTLVADRAPGYKDLTQIAAALPDLAVPQTVDYRTYEAEPFFPAIAKNPHLNGGQGVFWLDTPEQWAKFSAVVKSEATIRRRPGYTQDQLDAAPTNVFYPRLSKDDPRYGLVQARLYGRPPIGKSDSVYSYQEHIPTPTGNSSYRVLATAAGTILASTLYYGTESDKRMVKEGSIADYQPHDDPPTDALLYRDSLVFANLADRRSNRATGGRGIVLDPVASSLAPNKRDIEVLEAHDISRSRRALPEELRYYAREIGRQLGPRFGAILGLDFLHPRHIIEANIFPGSAAYADRYGLPDNQRVESLMYQEAFVDLAAKYR